MHLLMGAALNPQVAVPDPALTEMIQDVVCHVPGSDRLNPHGLKNPIENIHLCIFWCTNVDACNDLS